MRDREGLGPSRQSGVLAADCLASSEDKGQVRKDRL